MVSYKDLEPLLKDCPQCGGENTLSLVYHFESEWGRPYVCAACHKEEDGYQYKEYPHSIVDVIAERGEGDASDDTWNDDYQITSASDSSRKQSPRLLSKRQGFQQREHEKELLHAYGYSWKKEHSPYSGVEWVLYSPEKVKITIDQALQAIEALQVHHPGHESAIWAQQMLARPNMVTLDTETTGLTKDDEIIEIAIVDRNGKCRLDSLMNCERAEVPLEAMKIHGIGKLMLVNRPLFPDVWERLMNFLQKCEIVIYNAEFDIRMLQQTANRYGLPMPTLKTHCLLEKYSAYVGQPSTFASGQYRRMKLEAASLHFGVEQSNAHRALSDAQTTLEVLKKLANFAAPT
jgi:DNA polymerase-3 subunit epsilon